MGGAQYALSLGIVEEQDKGRGLESALCSGSVALLRFGSFLLDFHKIGRL
jgi:hypothetical protein